MAVPKVGVTDAVWAYRKERMQRGKARKTVSSEGNFLLSWAREMEGSKGLLVRNVTAERVETYLYDLDVKESTFNKYRAHLSQFNKWCIRKGYVRPETDWLSHTERKSVSQRLHFRPTPSQMLGMLENTEDPRDRIYLSGCMNTGCRESELISRQIKHVNLDAGVIYLDVYKVKRQREQPITAEFDRELRAWLIYYAQALGRELLPDDYLFPQREAVRDHDKAGRFTKVKVSEWIYLPHAHVGVPGRIVHRALGTIGEDGEWRATHTIRRGVALSFQKHQESLGRTYGDALRATAALLNHKSTAVTEIYIGRDAAAAELDGLMRGQNFLSAMVSDENVFPLRSAK